MSRIIISFCLFLMLVASPAHAEEAKEFEGTLDVVPLKLETNTIRSGKEQLTIIGGTIYDKNMVKKRDVFMLAVPDHEKMSEPKFRLNADAPPHQVKDISQYLTGTKDERMVILKTPVWSAHDGIYLLRMRKHEKSGDAAARVEFSLFRLKRDEELKTSVFTHVSTASSKKKYCDLDWAASQELGVAADKGKREPHCAK